MTMQRRTLLTSALLAASCALALPEAAALLRQGGIVVAFRHALAPGTFDPPGFRLGVCSTQRNLSDEGRTQARRIGAWFKARELRPAAVRSSPWCRCLETAELAFGRAEAWPALGSPRAGSEETNARSLAALQAFEQRYPGQVLALPGDLGARGVAADIAEHIKAHWGALDMGLDAAGAPRVLARLAA